MDSKVECICNILDEINEFQSIWEFERFQKYVDGLVKDGDFVEIPVQVYYAGFPEQWFKCKSCSQKWRLVHPDFPFKGIWEKIK